MKSSHVSLTFVSSFVLALTGIFNGFAAAQNLVSNPDFSGNAAIFTNGNGYFGEGGVNPAGATGWTTTGSGINGTLTTTSNAFAPATNTGSFLFMQGNVSASQAIATTGGTNYLFSFDAAARNGNTSGVSVFADNTLGASLTLDGANYGWLSQSAFQRYAFGFTATGAQTIQFNSSGEGDHTTDLTNVSVTAAVASQLEVASGTLFFTNTSGTHNYGFALTGSNQTIYRRPGSATYTGNITTDGSGGALTLTANEDSGANNLTFSGSTITLGTKNLVVTGTTVDGEDQAANTKVTLNNAALTTSTGNVEVGRGTLEVTGTTSLSVGGQLRTGPGGDWSRFVMNPGTSVTATGGVNLAANGVIASSLHLDGGTLTTPFIYGNDFVGVTHVIFNGTTVMASAASADFLQVHQNGDSNPRSGPALIKNGGAIINTNGNNIAIRNTLANFPGSTGPLTKSGAGTLTLSAASTYTGATAVNAGTLALQGTATSAMLTDNFSATGNPNTMDLNFNLAGRQTGSSALQNWTPAGNTQVGNATPVQQPAGTNGDYLLLAFGASATLNGLPLSTANVPGPLKVGFDMFKGNTGNSASWTSFTIRSTSGNGFPITGSGEFGFLYRANTGIQIFNNGGLLQDFGSTSGGDSFGVYLADATGTGSPFAGNGTKLVVTQGGSTIGSYTLNTGMGTSYLTFGSDGGMIGGVDNLAVIKSSSFQTNLLSPSTDVSLTTAGATLQLNDVLQTVASLSGVSGTSVNLGPLSRLTIDGSTTTAFNGVISGPLASIVKTGSSLLELGSANTYTAGTTISNGMILAHHAGSLGTGDVSIAAGANYLPWWQTGSSNIPNNFTLNGLGGFSPGGDKAAIYADGGGGGFQEYTLSGKVTLAATSNLGGNNSNNLRVSGLISGAGGLTKGGSRSDENNTLILGNTGNDYNGDTSITKGTLKLAASEVIPHGAGKGGLAINSGSALDLGGFSETVNRLSGAGSVISTASVGTPVYFTNDAGTGISASKNYTHALDFAEGTPVTINGVIFTGAGLTGANWNLAGANPSAGNGATGATGDISRLLNNFYYNGDPATLTLSGLTSGVTYETRLYERQWGGDRTQLFTVNGNGTGTMIFDNDASSTPSFIPFRFTATGTSATITTDQIGAGTYHWYGATNEVVAGPNLRTCPVILKKGHNGVG